MRILFEQKKPGRNRQDIEPVPFDVEGNPGTVGQLIEATVRSMVAAFNRRAVDAPADPDCDITPAPYGSGSLEETEIARLAETGRVAFGIVYNGNADEIAKVLVRAKEFI